MVTPLHSRPGSRAESGMTLIELLVVIALLGILLTLGAAAVRHFWLVQALDGATDEVVVQMRQAQTRVTSESHPRVYGVRFRPGSSEWGVVQFVPAGAEGNASATCTEVEQRRFGGGTFSAGVVVSDSAGGVQFAETDETTACRTQLPAAGDQFAFFYARGTATAGHVTLVQPILDRTETVTVTGLTGRVDR